MTDADVTKLLDIQARRAAIVGFEHKHQPDVYFAPNSLAELSADGRWRTWDMKAPYSTEACQFIAAAPQDIDFLLKLVEKLQQAAGKPEEVFVAWQHDYDEGGMVGVYSKLEFAEAQVHALAQAYNASSDEHEWMKPGRTQSGLLAYSDPYWNHRAGVTVYRLDAEHGEVKHDAAE